MSEEAKAGSEFKNHGFLANDIQITIDGLIKENKEWFLLLRDINSALQKAVVAGAEQHHGTTMHIKVLATFAGIRSLGNLQSAIINLERGMITEARIMARCLYENSFCMGALAENPDEFIPLLKNDNIAAKRGQAKVLRNGAYSLNAELEAALDKHLIGFKGNHLDWQKIANMSSIRSTYIAYKHLSDDAMHFSASSLRRYLKSDTEKETWQDYNFGPGTSEEVLRTASIIASPALGILVGYLQSTEDSTLNAEVNHLLDRLIHLNATISS